MNPFDTLRLVLDQQAALRRDARHRALVRSARSLRRGSFAHGSDITAGSGRDRTNGRRSWRE